MSDERPGLDQVEAFRTLARRLTDAQSERKFAEALQRLMTPSPEHQSAEHKEPSTLSEAAPLKA